LSCYGTGCERDWIEKIIIDILSPFAKDAYLIAEQDTVLVFD